MIGSTSPGVLRQKRNLKPLCANRFNDRRASRHSVVLDVGNVIGPSLHSGKKHDHSKEIQ